jgi:putative SOS response-associated peptidase YedK
LSSLGEVVVAIYSETCSIARAAGHAGPLQHAPTQPLPVVRILRAGPGGAGREWAAARWGLIPRWADDPSIGNRRINARAETAAEKPSFRNAFKHWRCLVPADGDRRRDLSRREGQGAGRRDVILVGWAVPSGVA